MSVHPTRRVNLWLRLTSSGWDRPNRTLADSELTRRSQLASWIILSFLLLVLLLVPLGLGNPSSLVGIAVFGASLVIALGMNRRGWVAAATWLVIIVLWLAIIGSLLGNPDGLLTLDSLPAYDLLIMSVIIAASVVSSRAAIAVAGANIAIMCLDYFLQPHSLDLTQDIQYYGSDTIGALVLLGRPVALEVISVVVAALWASGMLTALQRADRAEELAELERRELDHQHELEEGVKQLLAVHVHLANGDFNVRSPAIRNSLLWQIGSSLNNLIARLGRLAQADFVLRRTQEEANRVTEAIYMLNSGRQPIWPAASNTPLDRLVDVLRTTLTPRVGGGAPMGQLPPSPGSGYPGGGPSSPIPGPNTPPAPMSGYPDRPSTPYPNSQPGGSNAVPDWMRTLMANDGSGQPPMQPMQPPSDPRSAIPGSASGYGAPGQGYAAQPPQPDVNPWMLDGGNSGEPLDDSDLPEWLRHPNADR